MSYLDQFHVEFGKAHSARRRTSAEVANRVKPSDQGAIVTTQRTIDEAVLVMENGTEHSITVLDAPNPVFRERGNYGLLFRDGSPVVVFSTADRNSRHWINGGPEQDAAAPVGKAAGILMAVAAAVVAWNVVGWIAPFSQGAQLVAALAAFAVIAISRTRSVNARNETIRAHREQLSAQRGALIDREIAAFSDRSRASAY